jgi:hypothetical protein
VATPRRPKQSWWRNPVIMVPIIVAIIGTIALVTGGNVTIHQGNGEKP